MLSSLTLYLPDISVTEVPLEEPENELGDGLLPETVMVKSDGFLVPAPPPLFKTLVITLKNVNEPGKGGHFPFTGFEPSGQGVGVGHFPFTGFEPSGQGVGVGHFPFTGFEPSGQGGGSIG